MAGRFQFSIRFLLWVMFAVGAGVAAYRAEPSLKSILAVNGLTVLYATAALIGAVQTIGSARAFWIGTATLLIYGVTVAGESSSQLASLYSLYAPMPAAFYSPGRQLFVIWCAAPVNGLVGVFMHWVFLPREKSVGARGIVLACLLLIVLLVTAFFGGIRFGERHERARRDREDQEKQAWVQEQLLRMDEDSDVDDTGAEPIPE